MRMTFHLRGTDPEHLTQIGLDLGWLARYEDPQTEEVRVGVARPGTDCWYAIGKIYEPVEGAEADEHGVVPTTPVADAEGNPYFHANFLLGRPGADTLEEVLLQVAEERLSVEEDEHVRERLELIRSMASRRMLTGPDGFICQARSPAHVFL